MHAIGRHAERHTRCNSARVVVMGVSGSGKSTVGRMLSEELGLPFIDADELHPRINVEKMTAGIPLTDEDRWPWLRLVSHAIRNADPGVVVACSALKRSYRDVLRNEVPNVYFVHLRGGRDTLTNRLRTRHNHFMPAGMLDSQIDALEDLEDHEHGVAVDVNGLAAASVAIAAHHVRQFFSP